MVKQPGPLIEITGEVREAVRRSADEGFRATPRRSEAGGILSGRLRGDRLLIDRAEPIQCEHKYGAAYHLSPEEFDNFRAIAETIRSSRGRQIAGYFRSCVGDRFQLFPDDEVIVREVLPEAQFILLSKPMADGVSMGRLFERSEDGSWTEWAQFELVPASGAVAAVREAVEPGTRKAWWLGAAGGLLVVALLLVAWFGVSARRAGPLRTVSAPVLGMRISSQGDSFWLSWDRNSAAVTQASDGVLHINDGGGHRDVVLDSAQVQNGSVLYRPQSGDVVFNLELHRNGVILGAESIRALDGSRTSGNSGNAATAAGPVAVPAATAFRREHQPALAVNPTPTAPLLPDSSRPSATPVERVEVVEPPPVLATQLPLGKQLPGLQTDVPEPPKQQPTAPVEQQPKVAAAVVQTVSAPITPPVVKEPQPVRKVLPNLRNVSQQLLYDTAELEVQVWIDTAGRVTDAHPVSNGKKVNQALIGEAIKAAMQWTFIPATNSGRPVPATHVITFRFVRGS
jgi:hypothetical protein